jgi:hypothetical protein
VAESRTNLEFSKSSGKRTRHPESST